MFRDADAQDGCLIVVPLRGRDGATGVLTLERLGVGASFAEDEFELVQLFAAQVSIALQNAEVYRAIEVKARTDDLTGLYNHGTFQEWLERHVAEGNQFSIVMVDLDDFRSVNNTLGHQAGDGLLRAIASGLVAAGRSMDLVFRYGGDEFALILPTTDGSGAHRVAERVHEAVERIGGPGSRWAAEGAAVSASDRDCHVPGRRHDRRVGAARGGSGRVRGQALGSEPDRDGRGWPVTRRGVLAPGADAGRSTDNERDGLTADRGRHPGSPSAVRSHMSRATGRQPLGVASAASFLVLLLVVACVPQPAGRRTPPPIAASAAVVSQPPVSASPPTPSPSLTFSRPTATPRPTFLAYRVRSGDTITSIARKHDTTERSIGYWNRDAHPTLDPESSRYNPNDIRVGWTLLLIPGVEVDPDEITPPPTAPSVALGQRGGRRLDCAGDPVRRTAHRHHGQRPVHARRSGARGAQAAELHRCRRPARGGGDHRPPRVAARRPVRGPRHDGRAPARRRPGHRSRPLRATPPPDQRGRGGPRRARGRGVGCGGRAGTPRGGRVPRPPGDQRVLRRDAHPAPRRPQRPGMGPRTGRHASAARRTRYAPRTDPVPDQRPGRGRRGEHVPPPGHRSRGPRAGPRPERPGSQPGRRAHRGTRDARRPVRPRHPVPSRANRLDAEGVRAAVRVLRRRARGPANRADRRRIGSGQDPRPHPKSDPNRTAEGSPRVRNRNGRRRPTSGPRR